MPHSPALCARWTALFALLILTVFTCRANAERVRCPVCQQTFEKGEKNCPNDGTDLDLLGKDIDDEPAEEGQPPEEDDAEAGGKGDGYKRHDVSGDRQRVEEEEERGYSDRRKRMGEERRGSDAAWQKKKAARDKRRKEFEEKDQDLFQAFEQRRSAMWRGRHRKAEEERLAQEGYKKLRARSIWNQGAPLTSLGFRLSWMGEGSDSGPVTGAEIEVNPVRSWLRLGASVFMGARRLSQRRDGLFVVNGSLGVQMPWRYSPYIVARGGLGTLLSNRFDNDLVYLMRSVGAELGIDSRVTRSIVITPSFGYTRFAVDDARWDSFTVKLSVGF